MTESSHEAAPIDIDKAFERAMRDKAFLSMLLEQFVASAPTCVDCIQKACAEQDGEAVRAEAHRLKGAASNLSMHGLVGAAWRLEKMAIDGKLNEMVDAVGALEAEVERVREFVQGMDWSQIG